MAITEAVHGRSGSEPPARFDAACWPEMMWTSYATTVILSDNPVEITCRQCRFVLDLSEAGDSDAQDS